MKRFLAKLFQLIGVTMIVFSVVSFIAFFTSHNPQISPSIIVYGFMMLAAIFAVIIMYAGRGLIH